MANHPIEKIYVIFVMFAFMMIFSIYEIMWRNDRKWMIPTLIFPAIIIPYVFKNFEETKGSCFFFCLMLLVCTMISGLTGYSFTMQLFHVLLIFAFWPYYGFLFLQDYIANSNFALSLK